MIGSTVCALAASGMLLGQAAVGEAPAPDTEVRLEPAAEKRQRESMPMFGASLEAGVPDGAGVSFAFRPFRWLRLSAGPTYNAISPGIRAAATLTPISFPIAPSLTVEGGHYFPGDANALVSQLSGSPSSSPLLQEVGYQYASAHLGLELGSPRRWAVYLRGGISYVQLSVTGISEALGGGGTVELLPPNVRFTVPSAKLGFVLFIG